MQTEGTLLADNPLGFVKRTTIAALTVLLLLAICWCVWRSYAHGQLRAQIDKIRADHQPFYAADFKRVEVPDNENAAHFWLNAVQALPAHQTTPSDSTTEYNFYPPFPPAWHQAEEQALVANARAMALAHEAAQMTRSDWGDLKSDVSPYPQSIPFSQLRLIANILADAAVDAHFKGDDHLAIEHIFELLEQSRTINSAGVLMTRLVAVGIRSLAVSRTMLITPDLEVTHEIKPGMRAASFAEVRRLIERLFDESNDVSSRLTAVDYERRFVDHHLQRQKSNVFLLQPMCELSEERCLEQRRVDRVALAQPDQPAAQAVYSDNFRREPRKVENYLNFSSDEQEIPTATKLDDLFGGSLEHYVRAEFVQSDALRSAAIALAIRLYRIDHHRWPKALNDLVPDYLPSVPLDAMLPNHQPIEYTVHHHAFPDEGDRPMLHLGQHRDAVTDVLPTLPDFGQHSEGWRDLSRWHPTTKPATTSDTIPAHFGPR